VSYEGQVQGVLDGLEVEAGGRGEETADFSLRRLVLLSSRYPVDMNCFLLRRDTPSRLMTMPDLQRTEAEYTCSKTVSIGIELEKSLLPS
jgi:hypothetical protein